MVNLDYLYNKESAKRFFNVNYFVDKKLSFRTIENGTILPHKDIVTGSWNWGGGGIIDDKGVFVKGSFVKSELNGIYTPPRLNSLSIRNGRLHRDVSLRLGTFYNRLYASPVVFAE